MAHVYVFPAQDPNLAHRDVKKLIDQATTRGLQTRIFHDGTDESEAIADRFMNGATPVASDSDLKRKGVKAVQSLTKDFESDVTIIIVNPTTHEELLAAYPHQPLPASKKAARKKRTASAAS